MSPKAQKLYAVIARIRTSFNRLKNIADEMHRDIGVSASMRAVMEFLAEDGPHTVPDIARPKGVSRQHIQVNMDELFSCGFVKRLQNPAHKRSPLYALTQKGKNTFAAIRKREIKVLERLAEELPLETLKAAELALTTLNHSLIKEQEKGPQDD